jgi:hypothetical protein
MAVVASSFAQGRINFANGVGTQILSSTNAGVPRLQATGAGEFEVGLYIGSVGATAAQLVLATTTLNAITWTASTTSQADGLFAGGTAVFLATMGGFDTSGDAPLEVLVACWTAADGSSYAAALASGDHNGFAGESTIGTLTPTASPDPAIPSPFGTASGSAGLGSFGLNPIVAAPEPATLALAGLGMAGLLMFRRRK